MPYEIQVNGLTNYFSLLYKSIFSTEAQRYLLRRPPQRSRGLAVNQGSGKRWICRNKMAKEIFRILVQVILPLSLPTGLCFVIIQALVSSKAKEINELREDCRRQNLALQDMASAAKATQVSSEKVNYPHSIYTLLSSAHRWGFAELHVCIQ